MQLKLKQRVSKLEKRVLIELGDMPDGDGNMDAKETKNGKDCGKSSSRKRRDSVDSSDGIGISRRKSSARSMCKAVSTESNTSYAVPFGHSPIAEVFPNDQTVHKKQVIAEPTVHDNDPTILKKEVSEELTEAK